MKTDHWTYLAHAEIFGFGSAEQLAKGFGWNIDYEKIAQELEAKAREIRQIASDPKWIEWRNKPAA
jgi:hypothetical protein